MSEYQYYEFRAVDRPLNRAEMAELRDISTRAEITPTSFTNTYEWGNFKGDPEAMVDRYFDAFVYVSNWGTTQLLLRIPRRFLDKDAVAEYCGEAGLSLKAKKDHLILDFGIDGEPEDDWIEGESWMPSLISLRAELMRGDFRPLYLGWLASIGPRDPEYEGRGDGEPIDDEAAEPPVPPGLATLSAAQRSLAEFLRVDDELIEVAAERSGGEAPAGPTRAELAAWVKKLPAPEKESYLLRFVADEGDLPLRAEIAKRLRDATATKTSRAASGPARRTVSELISARDALLAEKSRKAAARAAKEKARRDREEAEARSKYLDALALREPSTWHEVEEQFATKIAKGYERAVTLLADLRELAARSGRTEETDLLIRDLRSRHAKKPGFLRRLDENKLGS